MKKIFIFIILIFIFSICSCNNQIELERNDSENIIDELIENKEAEGVKEMKINIIINEYSLSATLEDSVTGIAFYELINEGIVLNLEEYGGFEKVGSLGKTLPSNDKRITTKPGDLILYLGSEFSLMYGANTWSYTKIGKIDDVTNLKNILNDGDVTVTITKI